MTRRSTSVATRTASWLCKSGNFCRATNARKDRLSSPSRSRADKWLVQNPIRRYKFAIDPALPRRARAVGQSRSKVVEELAKFATLSTSQKRLLIRLLDCHPSRFSRERRTHTRYARILIRRDQSPQSSWLALRSCCSSDSCLPALPGTAFLPKSWIGFGGTSLRGQAAQ